MNSAATGSIDSTPASRLRFWAMRVLVATTLLASALVQASASWAGPELGS